MKQTHWALAALLVLAACSNDEPAGNDAAEVPGNELAGGAEPAVAPAAPPAAAEPAAPVDPETIEPIIDVRELNDWYRALLIDERAISDPLELETIGRTVCEGLTPCRAAMWFDAADVPAALPVAEAQLRYQVFAFGRALSGDENILWNCDVFPEFEAGRRCLPRPMN